MRCPRPDTELPGLDAAYPSLSALYFLCQNQGIAYVGVAGTKKAGGLFRRMRQHWRTPIKPMQFCYAFTLPQELLLKWETEAITYFRPEYNSQGRDYNKPCNDYISGLAIFLQKKKYFESFPGAKCYRIDFEHEKE
jgi:hypothetical protein